LPPTDQLERASQFLLRCIESYEQLETLRLLHSEVQRTWSVNEVVESLHVASADAERALCHLVTVGLVTRIPKPPENIERYHYHPRDRRLDAEVRNLFEAYEHSRVAVIQIMTRGALDRLRNSALTTFAECFRLKPTKRR
jgi:predicted transcriptional regulator